MLDFLPYVFGIHSPAVLPAGMRQGRVAFFFAESVLDVQLTVARPVRAFLRSANADT